MYSFWDNSWPMTKKKCNIFSTKSCNHLCFNCIFQSECVAESFSQLPNDSLQGLKIHVHLPHVWWPTRHHKTCLARHVHFYSLSCSHSSNDISSSLHLSSRWRRTTMSAVSCHRCPQSPGKKNKNKTDVPSDSSMTWDLSSLWEPSRWHKWPLLSTFCFFSKFSDCNTGTSVWV